MRTRISQLPTTFLGRSHRPLLVAALSAVWAIVGWATASSAQPPADDGPESGKRLSTVIDQYVVDRMARHHAPGAVCVVVRDGAVVLAKGYGYADLARPTPMSADRTRLRVGSISKLFAATAAMQLAERGRLDLRAPVSRYLDPAVVIRNPHPTVLTTAHLLSHTAGFDQRYVSLVADRPEDVLPMTAYLASRHLTCYAEPGTVLTYTNDATAVVGAVVERAGGLPFADYAEQQILRPLGMKRSTFRPVPETDADVAIGYEFKNGWYNALPPVYARSPACAGLVTTGADLARFMIAHLNDGRLDGAQILGRDAATEMHRRHFAPRPGWDGIAYGFSVETVGGATALTHGGIHSGFISKIALVPDQGLGVFIAYNAYDLALLDAPTAELLAWAATIPKPNADAAPLAAATVCEAGARAARARLVCGSYRATGYARQSFEKVLTAFNDLRISPEGANGDVRAQTPSGTWTAEEIAPFVYRPRGGTKSIAFQIDPHTGLARLLMGNDAFDQLRWYETPRVHRAAFLAFAGTFALILAAALARRWWRRASSRADRLAIAIALSNLAFLVGLVAALKWIHPLRFMNGPPPLLLGLLVLPLAAAALSIPSAAMAAHAWLCGRQRVRRRVFDTVAALAAVGFLPLLAYWNLLGFQF